MVRVTFRVRVEDAAPSTVVRVCGSLPSLGSWRVPGGSGGGHGHGHGHEDAAVLRFTGAALDEALGAAMSTFEGAVDVRDAPAFEFKFTRQARSRRAPRGRVGGCAHGARVTGVTGCCCRRRRRTGPWCGWAALI